MELISPPALLDSSRWRGLRVGLLGGSFNPPHKGHIHISNIALRTLDLDYIWWLVTPQNPLKKTTDMMDWTARIALCRNFVTHPRVIVSDLEKRLGTNKTFNTIRALRKIFTKTAFVWITGMDNALNFHKWYRWQEILDLSPTAHIARPPSLDIIKKCPLRLYSKQTHYFIDKPFRDSLESGKTYWILQRKMLSYSSTMIRKKLNKT